MSEASAPEDRSRGRRPAAAVQPVPVAAPTLDATIISMTLREAVRVTGISRDTLYDLIRAGEVASFRMGSRRCIDAASLRAYVARRAAEPVALRRGVSRRGRGAVR